MDRPRDEFLYSPTHTREFKAALALFNQHKFFEAHEALEDLWRALPPSTPAKKHLQGLVQLAVAFHHESRGNLRGAQSLLDRALRNLTGAETSLPALDLEHLHRKMSAWKSYLGDHAPRPATPRITLRKGA